ncbi:uncharacterized protein TrAtP1_010005 [Trichoderma atroviride]|uniref:uncharacterized protein n=1 Tax=Hypocrea atroviridis TaxID=63577 RepID=UPI00331A296D|nr:hypothetical protein TrAtP1_010005 [Trichoderma atroviride]
MTDFAIGIVSQGAQVCSIIANYIGSLKDRDEDLASISRQAQDLESIFQTLSESLAQGSKDPLTAPAAAHVSSSIQRCEAELNSLKQFVSRFSGSVSSKARPQDKIIQQAKKLKYPFQKSDISRVQKSLGAIKETLDLALQNLELRHMQLAISKLINLEEASRQALNSLHAKQDTLLELFTQDITTEMAAIGEPDPRTSIYKLASKRSLLATLCAGLEHHKKNTISTFDTLQRAPAVKGSSCPCRRHLSHQTKRASWLSWNFWDDETIYFDHYEGCKYFRSNGDERSRVRGLRLTGLVKTAIIVTFYTRTGAGGHSLASNLEYYATVDRETSPAFRALSVLRKCKTMLPSRDILLPDQQAQWERFTLAAIRKLESLFRLGKAGAKDVDSFNRSLLHAAAELVNPDHHHNVHITTVEEAFTLPIARLAKFLIKKQAFVTAVGHEPSSISLAEAFYPDNADIHASEQFSAKINLNHGKLAQSFEFFAAIPRAAEVFYGPLSVAVLLGDQYETCRLLQKHPKCLEERDCRFGLTPFHLALGNPECLRILVERSNPCLLVQSVNSRYTVLGSAILLSQALCDRREDQDESSCRCTLPLRILLEGGCPIIPYLDFRVDYHDTLISYASLHCKIHLAKSLLQRRQELKSIALDHLSPLEVHKFNLHRPAALDIYAMQVDEILRHRGIIEFGPLSTYLEEDPIHCQSRVQDCKSIYHELSNAEDANIYFNLGFHDLSARLDKPRRWQPIIHLPSIFIGTSFVKWLLDHDAPLCEWVKSLRLPWTGFVADAFILSFRGEKVPGKYPAHEDHKRLVHELEERMLLDNSLDSCECRCSPGGCTPFVARMKYMDLNSTELYIATTITAYFNEYGNALRRDHYYAAIRFITFQALGIAHTCDCGREDSRSSEFDAEEIAEIQDEYAELLEILESLTEEFEARVNEIFEAATDEVGSMTAFWSDYWFCRMSQVRSELSEANGTSKSAAEDLGVIWDPESEEELWIELEKLLKGWDGRIGWKGWDYYFQKIDEIE